MNTKLQAWSAGVVEAAVLMVVATVPLFVNFYGLRVFDFAKSALLVALASLIGVCGLIAVVESAGAGVTGAARAVRRPLVAAAALLGLATAVATATSIAPRLSFLGAPDRAQGLVGTLAVLALFGAVAWLGRQPARRARILAMLIAGSVPVSLYALAQALGLEVVPGVVESESRVFGTVANPIFLGAYLMLLWPLTLVRLPAAARDNRPAVFVGYALVALLQIAALVLTVSRGPQLGLAAGVFVLVVGGAAASGRRWLAWASVASLVAGALFLAVFNMPASPLAPLRDAPVIGRFGRIADTSTGSEAARMRIWRSVGRLLGSQPARLATGYGPEALKFALIPHAETYVAGRGQSTRVVDRAHNVFLDAAVMTGIPGALALLFVYGAWLHAAAAAAGLAATTSARRRLAALLALGTGAGGLAWLVAPLYAGALTLLGLFAGLVAHLIWEAAASRQSPRTADGEGPAHVAGGEGPARASAALALALLAAGAAAVVEAAFGIQTTVTQVVFWAMAGLVVALAAGDVTDAAAEPTRPRARQRRLGPAEAPSERGTVTITWSAGGAAIGVATGAMTSLVVYGFILFGTPYLADTAAVVFLLLAGAFGAGLVAALDARESAAACAMAALGVTVLYVLVRAGTLAAAEDASVLYAATVLWVLLLALVAGVWLRGRSATDAVTALGPAGILYPLLALPAGAAIGLLAIQPVRADIYFQSAAASFDAALGTDDAELFAVAEALFNRATALNPRDDTYYSHWGERFTRVGAAAADVGAAAQAFARAQDLVARAEAIEPRMPYHTFNRGHLQLVFAQKLDPAAPDTARIAANAAEALQKAFDQVPYDPQVANELALAKLAQSDSQGAITLLEYARDRLDGENLQTFRLLGQAYYAAGQNDKAKAALERALAEPERLGPEERMSAQLMLGEVARESGDLDTAIRQYEALLAGGGGDWRILFNLGLAFRDKGDFDRALAALSQTLQAAPPDEAARAQIQAALDSVIARRGTGAISPGVPTPAASPAP